MSGRRGGGTATTGGAPAGDAAAVLLQVRARGVATVLDERQLAGLDPVVATSLRLARDHGAPLVPVLDLATRAAEQRRRTAAEVSAAVAPARTVARTLVALPVVAVPGLAAVAGVDLVGFYLDDPLGRLVGLVVVVLVAVAAGWMRLLLATVGRPTSRPRPVPFAVAAAVALVVVGPVPALALAGVAVAQARRPATDAVSPHLAVAADLVAVAVAAGHDLAAALRVAAATLPDALPGRPGVDDLARHLRRLGLSLVLAPTGPRDGTADVDPPSVAPLARAVRVLADAGAPRVAVLRDLATGLRDDRARVDRELAARLPARLTFPTALVLVPATVLAIGAPIVVDGLAVLTGT